MAKVRSAAESIRNELIEESIDAALSGQKRGAAQRPENDAQPDSTSSLAPELIPALFGAGDQFPFLQENRVTLAAVRAELVSLFEVAMQWPDPPGSYRDGLRKHIVREALLLSLQDNEFGINQRELGQPVALVPADLVDGHDDLQRDILDSFDGVTSDDPDQHPAVFNALTEQLQIPSDVALGAQLTGCTDYPLGNPHYLSVVSTASGPAAISKMTNPRLWPELFPNYWTSVEVFPLNDSTIEADGQTQESVRERLDFAAAATPYTNLPSLQPYREVDVCLVAYRGLLELSTVQLKHTLEYQLADAATPYCFNSVELIYSFDTGFMSTHTFENQHTYLVQQKGIGFTYAVSPIISVLNQSSCYAWTKALTEGLF